MAMLVRIAVEAMGSATLEWRQIVIFASLASIVLGAAGAIGQTNIKRLLAYSSINNIGFALVGLAAGTREGVAAVLTYLAIYVVMTVGSFLCVLQMRDKDGQPVESIASLSGLSQSRKGLAAALAVFMFSLAGIPPLVGFWAKFVVFDAAVAAGLLPLAAIGIAASVILLLHGLPSHRQSPTDLLLSAAALWFTNIWYSRFGTGVWMREGHAVEMRASGMPTGPSSFLK